MHSPHGYPIPPHSAQRALHCYAGLPPNSELKPEADEALTRLKQDVASKAAAARAAEQRTSATQALQKAAAGQLDTVQQELARLQQEISQGMRVYTQVGFFTIQSTSLLVQACWIALRGSMMLGTECILSRGLRVRATADMQSSCGQPACGLL